SLTIDVLTGTRATSIPIWLGTDIHPIFIGVFAIIGHIFPLYIKFKGGKAVATSAGVALALHPIFLFIFVGVFLAILFTTSTVSIASILAVFFAAIGSFFLNDTFFSVIIWIIVFLFFFFTEKIFKSFKKEQKIKFLLDLET